MPGGFSCVELKSMYFLSIRRFFQMSNLVSYASPWTNEEQPRRRPSTMRRTYKKTPSPIDEVDTRDDPNDIEHEPNPQNNRLQAPSSLADIQNTNEYKSSKVNELLNKMNSASAAMENNKMGEFKPISPPTIQVKGDTETPVSARQYVPPRPSYLTASNAMKSSPESPTMYKANEPTAEVYNSYAKSYQNSRPKLSQPYYANMGIGGPAGGGDDKIMEKINYMIHLLEAQQHEKTNNITEEFLLYTFLGVFVIYVLDSFARSGKYIR